MCRISPFFSHLLLLNVFSRYHWYKGSTQIQLYSSLLNMVESNRLLAAYWATYLSFHLMTTLKYSKIFHLEKKYYFLQSAEIVCTKIFENWLIFRSGFFGFMVSYNYPFFYYWSLLNVDVVSLIFLILSYNPSQLSCGLWMGSFFVPCLNPTFIIVTLQIDIILEELWPGPNYGLGHHNFSIQFSTKRRI